jgi:hypothetical protein
VLEKMNNATTQRKQTTCIFVVGVFVVGLAFLVGKESYSILRDFGP